MSYVTYQNKMVTYQNKYVIGASPLVLWGFTGWTNSGLAPWQWDTFSSTGMNVDSAIEGSGTNGRADSNSIFLNIGDRVYFKYTMTLNFGTHPANTPQLLLTGFTDSFTTNLNPSNNGVQRSFSVITTADNYYLRFENLTNAQVNCSCSFIFYKI